jgi:dihydroorotate dehydrogenase
MLRRQLASWAATSLGKLPPEAAHRLAIAALRWGGPALPPPPATPKELACAVLGQQLPHPIGVAAGFDKDAVAIAGLARLGFSAIEVGSVTLRPQPGNPKPRLYSLPDHQAVINSYGFNSKGAIYVERRLQRRRSRSTWLGVNIGRNRAVVDAAADFAECAGRLTPYADYLVVNISSPNTPGLRDLQAPDQLFPLVRQVREAMERSGHAIPLFVKLSPDMEERTESAVVDAALELGIEGLIVSNTTLSRAGLAECIINCPGGLSGSPLAPLASAMLRRVARRTQGQIALIASGGIANGADAYARLCDGAHMIQIYTALIYRGPDVVNRMLDELVTLMVRSGVRSVRDLRTDAV